MILEGTEMKNLLRNQKSICRILLALAVVMLFTVIFAMPAAAEGSAPAEAAEAAADNTLGMKALAAGIAVGIAAAGGAVAMGWATAKSAESISRQPEAEGKIRTSLMLGLVFIETAIIYALLVVILIIFVL